MVDFVNDVCKFTNAQQQFNTITAQHICDMDCKMDRHARDIKKLGFRTAFLCGLFGYCYFYLAGMINKQSAEIEELKHAKGE